MSVRSVIRLLAFLAALCLPAQAFAYSYASPTSDPLIKQREAFLSAVNKGDWAAAETAYKAFKPELETLAKGDDAYAGDAGVDTAFADAISDKNADAAKASLRRAYVDEIDRRLGGAEKNISNYQTAQNLVVIAQAFFQAMSGDLKPDVQKKAAAGFQNAIDAVGKPGVFGYGAQPADPAALKKAHAEIMAALKSS